MAVKSTIIRDDINSERGPFFKVAFPLSASTGSVPGNACIIAFYINSTMC